MKDTKPQILKRIQELKTIQLLPNTYQAAEELYAGALSIASMVYNVNSPQFSYLREVRGTIAESKYDENAKFEIVYHTVLGFLANLEKEIEAGLLLSVEREVSGELFTDFVLMAKQALESEGKDVACVLACAALEDSLKRLATMNGLDVEDKDMAATVNALKAHSIVGGPQGKLLQSYTTLRNKAFHADWSKIDTPDVKSLIAFLEDFILKHFA